MAHTLIDSFSLYSVVSALSDRKPDDFIAIEWKVTLALTKTIMSGENLTLPPAPHAERAATGPYGILVEGLLDMLGHLTIEHQTASLALKRTKTWSKRRSTELQALLDRYVGTCETRLDSIRHQWLQSAYEVGWVEHVKRRGSLFDLEFAHSIANIIGTSAQDLEAVHYICTDINRVRWLSEKQPDIDEFRIARGAYIVSSLIRGQYYSNIAKILGQRIFTHPIRHGPINKKESG